MTTISTSAVKYLHFYANVWLIATHAGMAAHAHTLTKTTDHGGLLILDADATSEVSDWETVMTVAVRYLVCL